MRDASPATLRCIRFRRNCRFGGWRSFRIARCTISERQRKSPRSRQLRRRHPTIRGDRSEDSLMDESGQYVVDTSAPLERAWRIEAQSRTYRVERMNSPTSCERSEAIHMRNAKKEWSACRGVYHRARIRRPVGPRNDGGISYPFLTSLWRAAEHRGSGSPRDTTKGDHQPPIPSTKSRRGHAFVEIVDQPLSTLLDGTARSRRQFAHNAEHEEKAQGRDHAGAQQRRREFWSSDCSGSTKNEAGVFELGMDGRGTPKQ